MSRTCSLALTALLFLPPACATKTTTTTSAPSSTSTTPTDVAQTAEAPSPAPAAEPVDPNGRGGRLFDRWYAEADVEFKPGKSGGPASNGTLRAADGSAVQDTGHGFRLKNLFGWDLRGAQGVYGPKYQNKSYVLATNLLTDERPRDALIQWLSGGGEGSPALGDVLEGDDIEMLADFIIGVRSGTLPHPDAIWALSTDAPKNYTLLPGGDVQRGKNLYAESCSGCHGDDGTNIKIDKVLSLGAFSRTKAYEGWFKILSGHPGTYMHREIEFSDPRDGEAMILSILAAMCDRATYPPLSGQKDVADGDPRCGDYLQ